MFIALFRNARAVINAEKLCSDQHIEVRVRPVPDSVSSECGLCLEVQADDIQIVKEITDQVKIYEI